MFPFVRSAKKEADNMHKRIQSRIRRGREGLVLTELFSLSLSLSPHGPFCRAVRNIERDYVKQLDKNTLSRKKIRQMS